MKGRLLPLSNLAVKACHQKYSSLSHKRVNNTKTYFVEHALVVIIIFLYLRLIEISISNFYFTSILSSYFSYYFA
jgi:hypothetical protein